MAKWTLEQLQASVDGYLDMRERIASGERVNKTEVYRGLALLHGKRKDDWALRFGNVSQVMHELGYSLVPGLRPLPNVGTNVKRVLADMLQSRISMSENAHADKRITADLIELDRSLEESEKLGANEIGDLRRRVLRSVVQRRGQRVFRKSLIEVYSGKCAVSGCGIVDLLEAAHIYPFRDGLTNDLSNGLLLRADIHTLFDLRLIAINPNSLVVEAHPKLKETEYAAFVGRRVALRSVNSPHLSERSLSWHRSQCPW